MINSNRITSLLHGHKELWYDRDSTKNKSDAPICNHEAECPISEKLRFSYSVRDDKENLEVVSNLKNGIADKFRNVAWDSNPQAILGESIVLISEVCQS